MFVVNNNAYVDPKYRCAMLRTGSDVFPHIFRQEQIRRICGRHSNLCPPKRITDVRSLFPLSPFEILIAPNALLQHHRSLLIKCIDRFIDYERRVKKRKYLRKREEERKRVTTPICTLRRIMSTTHTQLRSSAGWLFGCIAGACIDDFGRPETLQSLSLKSLLRSGVFSIRKVIK